jgi:hypothetical protein
MEGQLTTKAQVDIPIEFDIELDQWLLKLKAIGVKTSKPKEIIKFAQIGFNKEKEK